MAAKGAKGKVIQIAATAQQLFALCDDGSIWYRNPGDAAEWRRVLDFGDDVDENCKALDEGK